MLADGAERYLALRDPGASRAGFDANSFDASAFAAMPEEIRLRLLKRAIDRVGHEGPAELGKVEALLAALDRAVAEGRPKLKQTLAGAVIGVDRWSNSRRTGAAAPPPDGLDLPGCRCRL